MSSDKTMFWKAFDYIRYSASTVLTLAMLALIVYAIGNGYAPLPGHPIALYITFVFVVTLLGMLEGLQIAILTLERANRERWSHMPRAYKNHALATRNHGLNVQRFLVGRQFFVVFACFLFAQLTTFSTLSLPLPKWLFILIIETGLPGVLVALSFGQLMPQLVASTHPVTFMNIPGSWLVIQIALGFEFIGVTHFSWVLTFFMKCVFRMNSGDTVTRMSMTRSRTKNKKVKKGRHSRSSKSKSKNAVQPVPGQPGVVHKPEMFDSFISREKMSVNIINIDSLYAGAEHGMTNAQPEDMADYETMNWLRDDSVKNVFTLWGGNIDDGFPSKRKIVKNLVKQGLPVPRYLLPDHHPQCIPAHIVVMELTRREAERCNSNELKGDEA